MKRRALSHDGLRHHGDVGYWSKRSLLGLLDCLLEQVVKTPINAGTSKADRIRPAKSSTLHRKAKTLCALKFRWTPVLAF